MEAVVAKVHRTVICSLLFSFHVLLLVQKIKE